MTADKVSTSGAPSFPPAQREQRMMRAVVQREYGRPEDVFEVREVEVPVVGDGEVLVRVHASPVSGTDWHIYRGLPYVARFVTGIRPRTPVPGYDMAGTVEAVGGDGSTFEVGDEVFGWCSGSYAEYVSVPLEQLAHKPGSLTLTEAAAVPIAAFTALQGVRDKGQVAPGDKVLITGASGGVGLYAVQIAKWCGAEVTGVCSTAKADMVRSLGADHVIDYTRDAITSRGERYDVLIDLYGNPSLAECRRALKPGGTLVMIGGTGGKWFMGVDRWLSRLLLAPFIRLKVRPLIHKDSQEDLVTIRGLIEGGHLAPVVDKTYPLTEVAEAIRYVTAGHARGQVVVTP